MNPLNFRKTSLGTRAIKIVDYNEWKAFKQNKGLLLSMGMEPLMLYGLLVLALSTNFSVVKIMELTVSYRQYALTGVLTFFMTYRATVDKEYGLLALKFLNGVQPWCYLVGMNCFPLLGLIFQAVILLFLGAITRGIYNLSWLLLSLLVVVISLGFWTSLGILLSTRISTYEKRDVIMTLVFTPVSFATPALYVFSDKLPWLVKFLVVINPLTYQLRAIRTVAFGKFELVPLLVAAFLTLGMMALTNGVLKRMPLKFSEH